MSPLALSDVAKMVNGRLLDGDATVAGVSTDTRSLRGGELFVALRGPNFDGHDFLDQAFAGGAAAAMVADGDSDATRPAVLVKDTLIGLGDFARAWRQRCSARVVAITGSNGKTTLKEMTAAILAREGPVLATRGNLNNAIGVPLTLSRLMDEPYAVIEMGANHPGEIDYLTRIALPDVAVLNNAGRAHLEGFGSLEGVARAKAEIIRGLPADGVFVFNADDRFADLWRELAKGRALRSFAIHHPADVTSTHDSEVVWLDQRFESRFPVVCDGEQITVCLQLVGDHNRMNALAAIAAATAAGADLQTVPQALAALAPVAGRLCPLNGRNGARLIDDSYNANPDSVIAALHVLAAAPGRRTLVLGDLAELGEDAAQLHRLLGEQAQASGIDRLLTCGSLSALAGESFAGEHRHFTQHQSLIDAVLKDLSHDDSILVKGSRSAGMERVVAGLREQEVAC